MTTELQTAFIRKAEPTDLERIVQLNQLIGHDLDTQQLRNGIATLLSKPELGRYLLSQIGDEVVGQIAIKNLFEEWHASRYWWLDNVATLPEFRGNGVCTSLLEHIKVQAGYRNIRMLRLYVEHANYLAYRVYKRFGFVEKGYLLEYRI